jgi:hypothetical protein
MCVFCVSGGVARSCRRLCQLIDDDDGGGGGGGDDDDDDDDDDEWET